MSATIDLIDFTTSALPQNSPFRYNIAVEIWNNNRRVYETAPQPTQKPSFTQTLPISTDPTGKWEFRFRSLPAYDNRLKDEGALYAIPLAGFSLACLVAAVFYLMSTRIVHAEGLAEQMTERLRRSVTDLERKNTETGALNEMSDLLQRCNGLDEVRAVLTRFAERCFPGTRGVVYAQSAPKGIFEAKDTWGGLKLREPVCLPEDCWALRRGHPHRAGGPSPEPVCQHVGAEATEPYLCVPLAMQGEFLGILHLRPDGGADESFVTAFADEAGLAIGNLKLRDTLRELSVRDSLTGLFNRRFMEETLTMEVARCQRLGQPLSVLMCDIDGFKHFNDAHGHEFGDTILSELGRFFKSRFRSYDVPCRYGGDELVVIMPGSALADGLKRAETLRSKVKELRVTGPGAVVAELTLSFGVAALLDHGDSPEMLFKAVDNALYRAKKSRDSVVAAIPETTGSSG